VPPTGLATDVSARLDNGVHPGPSRLKLASGYLKFDDSSSWSASFEDGEQYVALHRWNWLLRALTDEEQSASLEWGVTMMRSWLQAMGPVPVGLASESYTLGERIASALLFARLAGGSWTCLPTDIMHGLRQMAGQLCQQLEYYGAAATGNHPFNNARALYLAGKCLAVPQLAEVARTVMVERLQVILDEDGFMREGSSHYQLLFSRWLLELQFTASEFSDQAMLDLLEQPARLAVQRSQFFLVHSDHEEWQLPLIGDVSPDCEPGWLIDLPHSVLALRQQQGRPALVRELLGWARLWTLATAQPLKLQDVHAAEASVNDVAFQAFTQSGWYRLDWLGWTALWHAQAGGTAAQASHAHQDFASFVLYHQGREVLIDIGRPDYERGSAAGNYAMAPLAHNSITVDGLGPMLTPRDRFLPQRYRKGSVSMQAKVGGHNAMVELSHDGWARHGGSTRHMRRWNFQPGAVVLTDSFEGNGEVELFLALHWPAAPGSANSSASVDRQVESVQILADELECASADGMRGWRFPAYGRCQPCTTQILHARALPSATIRHTIIIKE
jgi:hypothetical protein